MGGRKLMLDVMDYILQMRLGKNKTFVLVVVVVSPY